MVSKKDSQGEPESVRQVSGELKPMMTIDETVQPKCPSCLREKIDNVKIETIEAKIQSLTLHVDGKVSDETTPKTLISILATCPHCGFVLANSIAGGMTFLKKYTTEAFVSKNLKKKTIYYTET